jgi:hypothetical protein
VAKLTQAEIKERADEWAKLDGKIKKAESDKGAELDPFVVEFNEKTKAIVERHDRKIAQLVSKKADIEDQVIAWLGAQGKPIALAGDLAVAANEMAIGSRKLDPKTFFEKVKERTPDFWNCVTIAIQRADKFLGKDKVDALASKESKLVASLKLK